MGRMSGGSPPMAGSWCELGPGRPQEEIGVPKGGLGPLGLQVSDPADEVAILMWSLEHWATCLPSPSCPAVWGSPVLARPRVGSERRRHPRNASLLPETPPFPGVPAFPGHPQPIWVLLRDRLGWLSPSHPQQVLSQRPKGGGTCARVCAPVWVHSPGFCPQAGMDLETLAF